MTRRLFVFDMDGTLLRGTTACVELARAHGTLQALRAMERDFGVGAMTTREFAHRLHALWGVLPQSLVTSVFDRCPKLANIDRVLSRISQLGGISCLITMAPAFFAERFADHGFDSIFASRFPVADEPFDPTAILDEQDKPRLTRRLAEETGCRYRETVAFGDSMSDYPLFRELEHTVAINGDEQLRALARYRYDGDDLLEAFERVVGHLARTRA